MHAICMIQCTNVQWSSLSLTKWLKCVVLEFAPRNLFQGIEIYTVLNNLKSSYHRLNFHVPLICIFI